MILFLYWNIVSICILKERRNPYIVLIVTSSVAQFGLSTLHVSEMHNIGGKTEQDGTCY